MSSRETDFSHKESVSPRNVATSEEVSGASSGKNFDSGCEQDVLSLPHNVLASSAKSSRLAILVSVSATKVGIVRMGSYYHKSTDEPRRPECSTVDMQRR